MTMKIATWNVQRPKNGGTLNPKRLQKIQDAKADIWILTETRDVISLGHDWHSFASFPIPDYHAHGETLVTIWSKWPIREVSASRFTACAEIIVPNVGPLLVYGTVVPWDKDEGFSKNFRAGRWEEHRRQINVQTSEWECLSKSYPEHLMCIAGDFNQHRGLSGTYKDNDSVAKIGKALLSCGLECITENSDTCANLSKPLVDHICLSRSLVASSMLTVWPYDEIDGVRLSDHHGVMVSIAS